MRQLIIVPNKYPRELGLRAFRPHTLGEGRRPWLKSVINSPIVSCIVSRSLLSQPGTWTMGRTEQYLISQSDCLVIITYKRNNADTKTSFLLVDGVAEEDPGTGMGRLLGRLVGVLESLPKTNSVLSVIISSD